MITEILHYRYTTDWNYDNCFDAVFMDNIQPNFPLVASTSMGITSYNKVNRDFYVDKKRRGRPSEMRSTMRDSLVSHVAKTLNLHGYISIVNAECSGSTYALHNATMLSKLYDTPVVVFVAENIISDEVQMWMFNSYGALDQNSGRAFDSSSSGFRMGVGSCLMLVKHPSVKYNMSPVATISNYNFYTNPSLVSNPGNASDLINKIKGIDFSTINVWNAHATGTPTGDRFEYEVFSSLVKHDAPIVGYKSYIGHCITASGALEICMSLDDYRSRVLRPNIILEQPIIDDCRIITKPISFPGKRILKANFGFGGKNAICQIDIE
jgi:3-oxoacyl-(acyl-carrier-protein) synthase